MGMTEDEVMATPSVGPVFLEPVREIIRRRDALEREVGFLHGLSEKGRLAGVDWARVYRGTLWRWKAAAESIAAFLFRHGGPGLPERMTPIDLVAGQLGITAHTLMKLVGAKYGPDPFSMDPKPEPDEIGSSEAPKASAIDPSIGTQVFVNGVELTRAEVDAMDSRIEKVRGGFQPQIPTPDREEFRVREKDLIGGRDVRDFADWTRVMTHWGFNWFTAEQLNQLVGPMVHVPSEIVGQAGEQIHDAFGRPIQNANLYWYEKHTEGQWRSDHGKRRPPIDLLQGGEMAFTMSDLVLGYSGPAAFDKFVRDRITKRQAARATQQHAVKNRQERRAYFASKSGRS